MTGTSEQSLFHPRFVWGAHIGDDLGHSILVLLWTFGFAFVVIDLFNVSGYVKTFAVAGALGFYLFAAQLYRMISYRATVYRILSDRIQIDYGLFSRHYRIVGYSAVRGVSLSQTWLQSKGGTGTVAVTYTFPGAVDTEETRLEDVLVSEAQRLQDRLDSLRTNSTSSS